MRNDCPLERRRRQCESSSTLKWRLRRRKAAEKRRQQWQERNVKHLKKAILKAALETYNLLLRNNKYLGKGGGAAYVASYKKQWLTMQTCDGGVRLLMWRQRACGGSNASLTCLKKPVLAAF